MTLGSVMNETTRIRPPQFLQSDYSSEKSKGATTTWIQRLRRIQLATLCGNCAGTGGNSELLRAKQQEEGKPRFCCSTLL